MEKRLCSPEKTANHLDVAKRTFDGKLLLSVQDAARALNLSPRTIYNELSRGRFPIKAKRWGRAVRFDARDVLSYIDSME